MADEAAATDETREVPVQINGKLRDRVVVPAGIPDAELEQIVLSRRRSRQPSRGGSRNA